MRTRLKALLALVAVLSAFAILPAMGVEGGDDASPSLAERVAELTEAVLGLEAEVEELTAALEAEEDESTEEGDEGDEGEDGDDGEGDDGEGDDGEGDEGDDAAEADAVAVESDDEASHGAIVSTVAQCAPSGRVARDAGLPNHGFFVSATAQGETLELVVGETTFGPYDLATQDGADDLCGDVPAMLTAEADAAPDDEPVVDDEDGEEESDEPRSSPGRSGEAPGRSGEAPGRSGDAPGRSGQAPGQMKKNG